MRKFVFDAHRWLGRAILLYLGFVFLTGTLLVFAPEIESVISPQMRGNTSANPASFGTVLDNAVKAYPDARPLAVNGAGSPWLATHVVMRQKGKAFLIWADPNTAEIKGQTSDLGFYGIVRGIHKNLLTGNNFGKMAVTAVSVPLLWQLFSGLVSYRRFWKGFFRAPASSQTPRASWGQLHRLVALWTFPVLLIAGLTALVYFTGTLGWKSSVPSPIPAVHREARLPAGFDGAALDEIIALAQSELPGLQVRQVLMPNAPNEGITVSGDLTAVLVGSGANSVAIDPTNLSVLGKFKGQELSAHRRLVEASDVLHFGHWAGQFSRVILAIGGILAVILTFSALKIVAWRSSSSQETGRLIFAWHAIWWPFRAGTLLAIAGAFALLAKKLF